MPDWGVDVWVQIAFGLLTAGISWFALRRSTTSNRIAEEANEIARRGVEAQIEADVRSRRANLILDPHIQKSGRTNQARFTIKNRGFGVADLSRVEFGDDDKRQVIDDDRTLKLDANTYYDARVGQLVDLDRHDGYQSFLLRVTYSDGTGNYVIERWVNVGPGNHFIDRQITVDDSPKIGLLGVYGRTV